MMSIHSFSRQIDYDLREERSLKLSSPFFILFSYDASNLSRPETLVDPSLNTAGAQSR